MDHQRVRTIQLDVAEVVTDFEYMTELNNRYFAPVWRVLTSPADTFVWSPYRFNER